MLGFHKKNRAGKESSTKKQGRVMCSNRQISQGFIAKVTFQERPDGSKDPALKISSGR